MLLNAVEFLYTLECVFQSPHLSLINSQDLGEHVDHNNRDLKLVWKWNVSLKRFETLRSPPNWDATFLQHVSQKLKSVKL